VCDINDQDRLTQLLQGKTAVFHTAALVGPFHARAAYELVNHWGTKSVVDACKAASVPVLVMTSSPSTKMDGSDICNLREDELRVPSLGQQLQEYSRTKAKGEEYALAAHSDSLRVCAIGPHQVYGPEDRLFLPSMLRPAATGQLHVFGPGDNLISCCHVDNAAHAHIVAARKLAENDPKVGGQFFVVTDGGAVYFWDMLDQAIVACGLPTLEDKLHLSKGLLYPVAYLCEFINLFRWVPLRLIPFNVRMMTMHRHFNIQRAYDLLGYRPVRAFAEAWRETIDAVRHRMVREGDLPAFAAEANNEAKKFV
jgi:nucleoside-diphosphate-sugar epimerase